MSRGWQWQRARLARSLAIGAALAVLGAASAHAADPIKIGQVAALSGASAQSGEAITRGLTLAIDEINAKGGLLGGRKLELVQRDDESNPPKGLIAARELVSAEKVAAVFGGIDTPVSLAIVPMLNKEKRIYMGVWAAGTGITRNGADSELRVPRLGGRRAGRREAARLRAQEIRRQEGRADAHQQSLGPVEREGPGGRAPRPTRRSRSPASRNSRTTTSTWCRS